MVRGARLRRGSASERTIQIYKGKGLRKRRREGNKDELVAWRMPLPSPQVAQHRHPYRRNTISKSRTVLELLHAFKGDLECEGVGEAGGIVQHHDVGQVHKRHCVCGVWKKRPVGWREKGMGRRTWG